MKKGCPFHCSATEQFCSLGIRNLEISIIKNYLEHLCFNQEDDHLVEIVVLYKPPNSLLPREVEEQICKEIADNCKNNRVVREGVFNFNFRKTSLADGWVPTNID